MLDHKNYIVCDCENGEKQLGHIETVLQAHTATRQREASSDQIEQDVENGPAFCRFAFPIPVHSRTILDKTDHKLAIPQNTNRIPVLSPLKGADLFHKKHTSVSTNSTTTKTISPIPRNLAHRESLLVPL